MTQIQGLVLIGTSMDAETPQSRDLGCWDGPAATSQLVQLGADLTPKHDFEPGQGYYDFLMDIGYGKNLEPSLKTFWIETIRDTYRGDKGKRRICMAAINLASRDGLYARLPYIKCPVLWLHVSILLQGHKIRVLWPPSDVHIGHCRCRV